MSKNITIQEGGIAKQITANKLKTNLVGGGTCLWVPEDETMLVTKFITENGTYKASEDGYYGYSEVTVSGVGSATGKDPDGSGDEATATVDPETGEIVISKLPSSIAVDTPPTKQEYSIGQTIDYSGMVVKAYLQSGGVWSDSSHINGIIPNNELVLPVSIVSADMEREYDSYGSNLDISPFNNPVSAARGGYVNAGFYRYDEEYNIGGQLTAYKVYHASNSFTPVAGATVAIIGTQSAGDMEIHFVRGFMASDKSGQIGMFKREWYVEKFKYNNITGQWDVETQDLQTRTNFIQTTNSRTNDGKTAYYVNLVGTTIADDRYEVPFPVYYGLSVGSNAGNLAWTMIYGECTEGGYKVPVQWPRPDDGKVLETSFNITVT